MSIYEDCLVSDDLSKSQRIEQIAVEIAICQRCHLHESRKNPVPGAGDYNARLVIVGEGPGAWEDEQGKPFVGRSGKLLDQIIEKPVFQYPLPDPDAFCALPRPLTN